MSKILPIVVIILIILIFYAFIVMLTFLVYYFFILQERPPKDISESPELSEIIEEEFNKLSPDRILLNIPQEMKVGEKERVKVRIAKTITGNLTERLKGRGLSQIEEIKVNTIVGARLTGIGFDIKPISHKNQMVAGEGFTQWNWDVIPLKNGMRPLFLTFTIRINIPDYGEEKENYYIIEKEIKVKGYLPYTIKYFFDKNLGFLIVELIIVPIYGVLLALLKKSRGF